MSVYIYVVYIYISADPGRRQGGARQGREVVDNKKYNNGSWEAFQSSRTATAGRSNSSKYPPTPAAQGGARKGKGFSDTAGVANFSILYPPTPAAQWCFPIRGLAAVAAKASAAAGGQGS